MIPVIISGGSGTRLWPLSRNSFPKQFCEIFEGSLITQAYLRVKPLGSPHILTTESLKSLSKKALAPLGLTDNELIIEPFGRNTAPAIALLCARLQQKGLDQEIVGIFPADHFITQENEFQNCVRIASRLALDSDVVTIGIEPTETATGYGYIELDKTKFLKTNNYLSYKALGFREKPNKETAEKFLAAQKFLWNAGMFVFQVKKMISLFEKHLPHIWGPIKNSSEESISKVYQQISPISIDFGIMEKLDTHVCIPSTFQWSDVGTWDSIVELLEKSKDLKSYLRKPFYQTDGKANINISSTDRTIGFIGVSNLIVVDTEDATLIAARGSTEKVKDLLDQIQDSKIKSDHVFAFRPWGKYEVLRDSIDFKSKLITVDVGAQISYQSHAKREEYWTIIKGSGAVILNDETIKVSRGSNIFIPIGCKHRIINNGFEPLVFQEIQLGTYFGEDDIVRYQDEYGRR